MTLQVTDQNHLLVLEGLLWRCGWGLTTGMEALVVAVWEGPSLGLFLLEVTINPTIEP